MQQQWATRLALCAAIGSSGAAAASHAASVDWTLVGWNDLGMHCMDDDYAVFSILPPYNVIHAQLVDPAGNLVRSDADITLSYEAVADPSGSIDTTSVGKTNFWDHVDDLFGVALDPDQGLAGFDMPGRSNAPQTMRFDPARTWWSAEGIPITPLDDSHRSNTYPLMRVSARDGAGRLLATTDIVLPVSSEMDCRDCHASGSGPAAQPDAGWVHDPLPERDHRLNILRLHDERRENPTAYAALLESVGYDPDGLFATALGGHSVLCATCHSSNALPGATQQDVGPLTHVVHSAHATAIDPTSGLALGASSNRSACYSCHPGATTKCLRGAMGNAVAPDGTLAMQCQSCHGSMAAVGAPGRQGWLDQPTCQSCHTGTAVKNSGQIRFSSVFDANGKRRAAADDTFATTPDQPARGLSLYRFSHGHGNLSCESCHGSTHAEFPSSHANDNLQGVALQGHAGVLADCGTCHASVPETTDGGPHGMHPIGGRWVEEHGDAAEDGGDSACRSCHGLDFRGTELSDALGDRSFSTEFGTKQFFQGARVSCFACHSGPDSESRTSNRPAQAEPAQAHTAGATPVSLALSASDPDRNTLSYRIISQPEHGTVGISGNTARYLPEPGFTGTDRFTWSAWDGSIDSNLATGTITVGTGGPPPATAPAVTNVNSGRGKFSLVIAGANFAQTAEVFVADAAWTNFSWESAESVTLLGGKALKALFPKQTWVPIRIVNPDGGSVAVEYERKTRTWRPASSGGAAVAQNGSAPTP